jgi:hypothetical protein
MDVVDEMKLDLSGIDFQCSIYTRDGDDIEIALGSDNSLFELELSTKVGRELFNALSAYFDEG